MPPNASRNTKSDMVDMMTRQSVQMTQMMSQRMALSLVTSEDEGQSHKTMQRTNQRDKLLLSLILNAVKVGQEKSAASDVQRHIAIHPNYLPVLPRLPVPTSVQNSKDTKHALDDSASNPASMTSRWRARAPAKLDQQPLGKVSSAGRNSNINDDVITGIRIKECVQALHKVYLNPERRMLRILRQIYDSNLDLSSILTESSSKEQRHKATETLASFIEHIAYEMTFVSSATGNLGTENRSNLYHILKPKQSFPAHYFWGVEKDVLGIDANNRTNENIQTNEGFVLLIGLCVGRALVATILRSPHQFGLIQSAKTEALSTKVRLIVTLFIYLVRRLYAPPKGNPVAAAFPDDLSKKLFTDETMAKLYKKLETSFHYAEKLLRDWGQNYISKIRRT